jgi:signal transduction histidine kinase
VRADPGQVGQVLMNLVVNARDAMPEGGMLTIATAAAQFDAQYVSEHPGAVAGDFIAFSVTDSGTGIAPEVLPHIFDPFFTTKAPGVGTGLGLHITHSVVSRHGGRIEVESEPGKGTCFIITLPPTVAPPAPDEAPAAAPAP